MPSSAGLLSPQLRLRVSLTALALAALVASLLLAYASVTVPRSIARAQQAAAKATLAPENTLLSATPSVANPAPARNGRRTLWTTLTPWALAVDAVAVLGLVVIVRMWRR